MLLDTCKQGIAVNGCKMTKPLIVIALHKKKASHKPISRRLEDRR